MKAVVTHQQDEARKIHYRTAHVDGCSVFYREAGDPASPRLLLLGGLPASFHQFRNLIPALADRFHVLSPDYPGFGNTEMPDDFEYTFDRLSEMVEGVLKQTDFYPFGFTCMTTAARSATASSVVTRAGSNGR
jgi:pimeloyl-ACP methyl ester carboxylesterase